MAAIGISTNTIAANYFTNYGAVYTTTYPISAGTIFVASKEPETPEQWLRNRVKEICDLVKM